MGFFQAINSVFSNYFNFSGRAPMSEYWWFFLFETLAVLALGAVDLWYLISLTQQTGSFELAVATASVWDFMLVYYAIATFVPRLSVSVRRLHDAGMSGFMYLLIFIPAIGQMLIYVLMLFPSAAEDNIYGPPHRGGPRSPSKPSTGPNRHDPMQGYAVLDRAKAEPTPEMIAARKAEVHALYRQRVLGENPVPAE